MCDTLYGTYQTYLQHIDCPWFIQKYIMLETEMKMPPTISHSRFNDVRASTIRSSACTTTKKSLLSMSHSRKCYIWTASTSQEGSFLNLAKPQILHRHHEPTDHLSCQQNEAGIARELRLIGIWKIFPCQERMILKGRNKEDGLTNSVNLKIMGAAIKGYFCGMSKKHWVMRVSMAGAALEPQGLTFMCTKFPF